jgi:sugar/nucleoside kinase (ribokinase family)
MKSRVITLGDLVADLVVPIEKLPLQAQQHQRAREITLEAGGTGNFLVIAARLGLEVTALGTVGQDYYGQQVLQMLAQEGVDVAPVVVPPGSQTTTSIVLVDDEAQHVFVGRFGPGSPLSFPAPWREIIEQADGVFTTGYALHPSSAFTPEIVLTCLEIARQRNIPTFFDLGPAAFIVNQAHVQASIAQSTVFLATHEEISTWTELDDPLQAARQIQTQGPSMVIIKMGAAGCMIVTPDNHVQVDAFRVKVRDTAGAGDAFDAACVYGYVQEFSPEQIGALANAVGSSSVTKLGTGTRLPQKHEIEQLLRDNGHSFLQVSQHRN